MPKGIMFVPSQPASPDRDDEYNTWYSKTHIPEVCEVPGVVAARRYKIADPAQAVPGASTYIALDELEADDFTKVFEGDRGPRHRRSHPDERRAQHGPAARAGDLRALGLTSVSERVSCTVSDGIADVRRPGPEAQRARPRHVPRHHQADQVAADRSVRVVVLSGEGKAFCAGLDMSLFAAMAAPPTDSRSSEPGGATDSLRADAVRPCGRGPSSRSP